jgi:hypothetical protein
MNMIDEQQFREAQKTRQHCLNLRVEKTELERKQKSYEGKRRAQRIAEIEAELETHGVLAGWNPVQASVWVEKQVGRLDTHIEKERAFVHGFITKLSEKGIAHTIQWDASTAIGAELEGAIYENIKSTLLRVPLNELLCVLSRMKTSWAERVIRHAQRGTSRSSSEMSNKVDAAQMAVYAELADPKFYSGPWAEILWNLESVEEQDVLVWEDRTFEEEDTKSCAEN